MITIKSKKFPDDVSRGEELSGMLSDLDDYSIKNLLEFRRFSFWYSQLQRFTVRENRLLCGHSDWLIKRKSKTVD